MLNRYTIGDLIRNPSFTNQVDLANMICFEPSNPYHMVLADVISEGVYRHQLIKAELPSIADSCDAGPLILEFNPGLAQAKVSFEAGVGQNSGMCVFLRTSGGTPSIFRPGGWLMRFKELQDREDEELAAHFRLSNQPEASANTHFQAIDDSDLFGKQPIGFRLRRSVVLPS